MVTKYLPKFGITCTLVPAGDDAAWEAAVQPNSKMIYLETPTNPQLEVLDLEWIGQFTKRHNLIFNVDNCFATPLLQNPIAFGADLVVHADARLARGDGAVGGAKRRHAVSLGCRRDRQVYQICRDRR